MAVSPARHLLCHELQREQGTGNGAVMSPGPDSPQPGSLRGPGASAACMWSLKNNFFFLSFLKNKKPDALFQIWS